MKHDRCSLRRLIFAAVASLAVLGVPEAQAGSFLTVDASQYAVLYEGHGGKTLSLNNFNITGNVGIGATGTAQLNGPGTITGDVDFSASNSGQFSNSGVTLTPSSGNPRYSVLAVTSALTSVNSLSQSLGLETGTSTTISTGGSINASAGTLDAGGNRVFKVTSISFPNGKFTVNGAASDYVVLNIAGSVGNNGLNGSVVLAGGISADHVLFNYTPSTSNLTTYNSDYTNLTGGPTMTISTNGAKTTGIFLDPTGDFQVNHSDITGFVFGGDTHNSAFVSGAKIALPPVNVAQTPEPASLTLLGIGVAGMAGYGCRRRKQAVA
jgi:hypothetical protein